MAWAVARERLGAELIGARDQVAERWRAAVQENGLVAHALGAVATDLVLNAGAALADGAPPETAWGRCGGLLRLDPRDNGRALSLELTLLWRAMGQVLTRVACSDSEARAARDALALQLDAAQRGATALVRAVLFDEGQPADGLRYGGVVVLSYPSAEGVGGAEAAA